jgi:hypothetical protein
MMVCAIGACNFELLPLLRSGCKEKVTSDVISCVTWLRLGRACYFKRYRVDSVKVDPM